MVTFILFLIPHTKNSEAAKSLHIDAGAIAVTSEPQSYENLVILASQLEINKLHRSDISQLEDISTTDRQLSSFPANPQHYHLFDISHNKNKVTCFTKDTKFLEDPRFLSGYKQSKSEVQTLSFKTTSSKTKPSAGKTKRSF